jgi:hypothetical protein
MTKTQIKYKGFISPSTGNLPKRKRLLLAKVYSAGRTSDVKKNPKLKESKANKQKWSKIAWSVVKNSK